MAGTSNILMIRPVNFAFNEQTAVSNAFQTRSKKQNVQDMALQEFNTFVKTLEKNGVDVTVVEDTPVPLTPDSIFPNNWISFHDDGSVFLYPMQAENRRLERKPGILQAVKKRFRVSTVYDLSGFEKSSKFLEGTGSMVLDYENKIVYSCRSPRTHQEVLDKFCRITGYNAVSFSSDDMNGVAVYHTNVMMCIGSGFAVICIESISDNAERKKVESSLTKSEKEVITISRSQMSRFAGNMIQLCNKNNELLLAMSENAFDSLLPEQVKRLENHGRPIYTPLNTIEENGGGSARCMIAEIYLPEKTGRNNN